MRFPLRWKILLFTALTPLALTAATLWIVNRSFTTQVRTASHENLQRASLVFERVFEARASKLAVAAQVIVRDPRFFSVLAIHGASQDPQYRATVVGVARDFDSITRSDLFEVVDRRGRLLASVGRQQVRTESRRALVREALDGRVSAGVLVDGERHFQVAVVPVRVGAGIEGALLLGSAIAEPLARELSTLTHSDVTFVSRGAMTGRSSNAANLPSTTLSAMARPAGAADRATSTRPFEVHDGARTSLALVRTIPGSRAMEGQRYVMQVSLDEEGAVLRDVQSSLLRTGLYAALAALLVGFLIAERITRPVLRLVRGAEEMARGNYDYSLGRPDNDEIGYLALRFGEMREHERTVVLHLQEAARVRSEFITLASHELRTPISVIKAYHELFASQALGPISPKQVDALQAIERSLKGLVQLAESATRMAQLEQGAPELDLAPHEPREVLQQAVAAVLAEARGRRVAVSTDAAADLGVVPLDRSRLVQAVASLVRNGIRFTPDGGHVVVAARREEAELVIDVRDDGVGIAPERQQGLFERPFMVRGSDNHHSSHTLEFNSGGLGLGLPIAHGLVVAHGGTLAVVSGPGKGSTFTIRLPIGEWQQAAAA